jgi:DNA helicase HerA-like ATPase
LRAAHATAQPPLLKYANRHGLITGATGTGKTVTLQILAESFSANAGVPVILSDVKGDLSGIGERAANFKDSTAHLRIGPNDRLWPYAYRAFPVTFWDLFGEQGHPVRTTVSEMGPLLAGAADGTDRGAGRRAQHRLRVADEQGCRFWT